MSQLVVGLGFGKVSDSPRRRSLTIFLALSTRPPSGLPRFRRPDRPCLSSDPIPISPGFHLKRVFFRLRSAGSACFHRVHRDHYMLLLLLPALNTCIRGSGLVHRSGGEYSGLGGVPRGSDLVSLPRAVTVSERATGAAGTGRMTRRVESQGRLPASRSRDRATRS